MTGAARLSAPIAELSALGGSSNLDPLSLRCNYELNPLVVDPTAGRGMRAMFERDLENARRIDLASWRRGGLDARGRTGTTAGGMSRTAGTAKFLLRRADPVAEHLRPDSGVASPELPYERGLERDDPAMRLLVLIRTFLSFSLEVELSGRWPWQDCAGARSILS